MTNYRRLVLMGVSGLLALASASKPVFAETVEQQFQRALQAAEAKYGKAEVKELPTIYTAKPPISDETRRNLAKEKALEKFDRQLFDEALRAGGRDLPR